VIIDSRFFIGEKGSGAIARPEGAVLEIIFWISAFVSIFGSIGLIVIFLWPEKRQHIEWDDNSID
jgi:hypothetical protein